MKEDLQKELDTKFYAITCGEKYTDGHALKMGVAIRI